MQLQEVLSPRRRGSYRRRSRRSKLEIYIEILMSLKAGVNYFPDLPDSFYTNNEFPACNIHIGAKEITAQTKANQ